MQFVSATQGWVVGSNQILATTDGGAHWSVQLAGSLDLTSVDFVNGRDGWAVGTDLLLVTSDGGAHWTSMREPCPVIRSVHFISPLTGFAVAGGTAVSGRPEAPETGGVVLETVDGGRTWYALPTPADAQTVCFSDPLHGWLGADGHLYRSEDGGGRWAAVVSAAPGLAPAEYPRTMDVECAGGGAAWALDIGPGMAMGQQPHVGYHADQRGAAAIFAEGYFQPPGTYLEPSPGADAGPFSAISPSVAAFVDGCVSCGTGTAPWDLVTDSGARLTREGDVGDISLPEAASFLSPQVAWAAGQETTYRSPDIFRQQQRIVFTDDGGRTWHVQYAGPWTS